MVSLYIVHILAVVFGVVSVFLGFKLYTKESENGELITQLKILRNRVADLSNDREDLNKMEKECNTRNNELKAEYELLKRNYNDLLQSNHRLESKSLVDQQKLQVLQSKYHYAFYNSKVFDNTYIRDIYINIMDRNLIKTTDVKYLAFVNTLLYIDSLNTYEMIWSEVDLGESTQIYIYQLDRCIYELLNKIKYDNFEIIMAGIFCLLGFSYGLQMIHKQKNVGYILSKKFANEFLHLHFNDKKYIDTIIEEIKNSQKEYVDSLHPIIKSVIARIPCNIITSEELQKNIVPIVDFKPKSVCNTVISVMSK